MKLERRLREVLVLQKAGAEFADRVMARLGSAEVIDIRTRRRTRHILLGTLLVIGIAAAMFVWKMSGPSTAPGETQAGLLQPALAEPLDANKESAGTESPPTRVQVKSIEPSAAPAAASQGEAPRRFTILVMPSRDSMGDARAKSALKSFQSALALELGRKADLALLDADAPRAADGARADFRLTLSLLQVMRLPSKPVRIGPRGGADGIATSTYLQSEADKVDALIPGLGDNYWPVEVMIDEDLPAPRRFQPAGAVLQAALPVGRYLYINPYIGVDGAPMRNTGCVAGIAGSLRRFVGGESLMEPCRNTEQIAAALVDAIRQQAPDPSVIQKNLAAQLRDATLPQSDRNAAMSGLFASAQRAGIALDGDTVAAIAQYIAGQDPERRVVEWEKLGFLGNPELVPAMLTALRQDADERVRLTLLGLLISNHGAEQSVLDVISRVSRDDPREIVRMAARRALHGDAEWLGYVKSTLRNGSLTFSEKLQPLMLPGSISSATFPPPTPSDRLRAAGVDDEVAGMIVQLVRENLTDAKVMESTLYALIILEDIDRPEVQDLQLEIVQMPLEQLPSGPGITGIQLATLALPGLARHRDEPRVRKVLDQILAGQLNPALRSQVEKHLAMVGEVRK
ncbi:MAG: HEAT repeat domain-containing protein [Pseudomonadota bacterium]